MFVWRLAIGVGVRIGVGVGVSLVREIRLAWTFEVEAEAEAEVEVEVRGVGGAAVAIGGVLPRKCRPDYAMPSITTTKSGSSNKLPKKQQNMNNLNKL